MNKTQKQAIKILGWVGVLLLVVWGLFEFGPHLIQYTQPEKLQEIETFLKSFGKKGWFAFLGMQILKVVVAIIPGEPIELLAGAMFGSFGGLITCILGNVLGSMIVFYLVKRYGIAFTRFFANSEKIQKLSFLKNAKKLELFIFIMFFLPGTPKDILTYFAPMTNIKPLKYFIIVALARIPSILTSTITGANFIEGKFELAILVFGIATIISVIGYLIHLGIMNYHNQSNI